MKSQIVEDHKDEKRQTFNKRFGIYHNGDDNLYPLVVENLYKRSPTAKRAANMQANFLSGGGFTQDFGDIVISRYNNKEVTPNSLLFQSVIQASKQEGFFIHVQYNSNLKPISYKSIPYNLCRVGKQDDDLYSGKIVISPKGWGRYVKKEDVKAYDVFNDNLKVVQEQVKKSGGIQKYLGQIMYFKFDDEGIYSESLIDPVAAYCNTEYKMGLFFDSMVSNGFTDITVAYHKETDNPQDVVDLKNNLHEVKGIQNANKTIMMQSSWLNDPEKDGNVVIKKIETDIKPDRYKYFDEASEEKIISAHEIPLQLIKLVSGKLGATSGEDLKMWQAIYNTRIAPKKTKIEGAFSRLFRNYYKPFNPSKDWTTKQYSLLPDGTAGETNINQ